MPRHDFVCPACSVVLRDVYRPAAVGALGDPPCCAECGQPMEWIPQAAFDMRSDSAHSDIPKFTFRDGRGQLVEVSSLHQIRQLEKDSEIAARNGEGQQINFRAYSQNRGNRLDGSLGDPPDQRLDPAAKRKFGLRGATRQIDASGGEPAHSYGPGVNDSNTSALKGGF